MIIRFINVYMEIFDISLIFTQNIDWYTLETPH